MIAATASIQKAPQENGSGLSTFAPRMRRRRFPRQSYARSGSCSSTSGADVTKQTCGFRVWNGLHGPILDAQERFPSSGQHRSSILRIVLDPDAPAAFFVLELVAPNLDDDLLRQPQCIRRAL